MYWISLNDMNAYHTVYFWREIFIKRYPFKCTSIWIIIIKWLWRGKKMFKVTLKLQRYFVIYVRSPLKMQKIIKPRNPSKQLLEIVSFAFTKFFDSLVKIAVFRASLFLGGDSRHAFLPGSQVRLRPYSMTRISQKKERCPKNSYFD